MLSPSRLRRSTPVLLALGVALALTACSEDQGSKSAADEIQSRAQAGLLASYTANYAVTDAKGGPTGRLTVSRTPTALRLDVTTASGMSTSITTPERTVACQQPANGKQPTCLVVAAAGRTPPAAFDPVLRKVFGDALRVLANDDNGLTVVDQVEGSSTPLPTAAAGETGQCFVVTSPASLRTKIASGSYCLTADGIPLGMKFASGTATLNLLKRTAPPAGAFVPTTAPTPLPT